MSQDTVDIDSPEFLERLRKYDPDAFTLLFRALKDRIYGLALRLTRNRDDAEEVLQEAFFAAFDKIETFKGNSRLSTWIYAIASNAALSRLRKKESKNVTLTDELLPTLEKNLFNRGELVFAVDPSDPTMQHELEQKLEEAIETLPEGHKEIFVMKELEHIPIKEIAAAFDLNPGAVKTRLHRARLMLRSRLSDYWGVPV